MGNESGSSVRRTRQVERVQPLNKSIFKNSIYKLILSVFNLFVPLLVMPHINSLLTEKDFNEYNYANSQFAFFLIFAVFGIYNYGVREISKVRNDKKKRESLFTNLFFFGIITSVVTSIGYFIYVMWTVDPNYQILYNILLVQILGNILSIEWMNEAVENYGFITLKTVIVRILYVISIFVFVRKPQDVIIYSIIMSSSIVINNAISFFYVKKDLKFRFDDFRLARYIKPLFILTLISNANLLYTQLDRLFIGRFAAGDAPVTEYANPSNIINMVGVMLISIIMVSIPRLSYYVGKGMEKDYMELLNKSTRAFFMVLCPACIGLFCLSYEAIYIYTKGVYAYSYHVLEVFSIRFLINSLYTIFTNQILYIHGKEKSAVKIIAIGGVLNLIFDSALAFTGFLTPVSAIVSTAIAETIMLSIMYWYIRTKVKVPFKLFAFSNMKYLYFSLPFLVINWAIRRLDLGVLMNCVIIIPLCGLTYLTILLITKDDMLVYFIDKFKVKFQKNKN